MRLAEAFDDELEKSGEDDPEKRMKAADSETRAAKAQVKAC